MANNSTTPKRSRTIKVGTRVYIGGLKVTAEVREVQQGATVRYRCRWWEPAVQQYREANLFREDFTVIRNQKAAAA